MQTATGDNILVIIRLVNFILYYNSLFSACQTHSCFSRLIIRILFKNCLHPKITVRISNGIVIFYSFCYNSINIQRAPTVTLAVNQYAYVIFPPTIFANILVNRFTNHSFNVYIKRLCPSHSPYSSRGLIFPLLRIGHKLFLRFVSVNIRFLSTTVFEKFQ
jgi:hypothetical protein